MPEENGNKTISWKVDNAEFRGFMKASVEGLKKTVDDTQKKVECIPMLKRDNEEIKKDVKSLHGKVSNLRLKVAGISGTIALIVTIIILLLKDKIF